MKRIFCILLILCPYLGRAQLSPNPVATKALSPGNTVPDIVFTNLFNSSKTTLNLHQLKGKLILLDFWATWCMACIKKFPLLDSLQQQYGDQLQLLLINSQVTNDNKAKLQVLWKKLQKPGGGQYPFVTAFGDTTAFQLFPYQSIPQYVWLDSSYTVRAVTGAEEVTAQNVAAYLAGNYKQLVRKQDQLQYNRSAPWFINGNAGKGDNIIQRSTLAGWLPGMSSGVYRQINKAGLVTAIRAANQSPYSLLLLAHNTFINSNRVVNLSGNTNVLPPAAGLESWTRINGRSYELLLPARPLMEAMLFMQQDLQRLLGLYAVDSIIMREVYTLTADSNQLLKYVSKGEKPLNELDMPNNRYMLNTSLETLTGFLDERLDLPVLDESGFTQQLDLRLQLEQFDIATVSRCLQPLGLSLQRATRKTRAFIIHSSPKQ